MEQRKCGRCAEPLVGPRALCFSCASTLGTGAPAYEPPHAGSPRVEAPHVEVRARSRHLHLAWARSGASGDLEASLAGVGGLVVAAFGSRPLLGAFALPASALVGAACARLARLLAHTDGVRVELTLDGDALRVTTVRGSVEETASLPRELVGEVQVVRHDAHYDVEASGDRGTLRIEVASRDAETAELVRARLRAALDFVPEPKTYRA